jgi:hypothetical protein
MDETYTARLRISMEASNAHKAQAQLDELVRYARAMGLRVEELGIDHQGAEEVTPRERPPSDRPHASP